ncbi:hypothetical protein BJ508DRAFT_313910 [Ascobolus immersus RN42]|uniref:Uncharacterized protein n=1 Tax=Ascobolus immersus RN42 TaxID=1160509 RepID=A0A3N4HGX8_ASCIM|nr:hypothetical protein BJ508DRAFT_313910 [Ascobolus immersus RN42]
MGTTSRALPKNTDPSKFKPLHENPPATNSDTRQHRLDNFAHEKPLNPRTLTNGQSIIHSDTHGHNRTIFGTVHENPPRDNSKKSAASLRAHLYIPSPLRMKQVPIIPFNKNNFIKRGRRAKRVRPLYENTSCLRTSSRALRHKNYQQFDSTRELRDYSSKATHEPSRSTTASFYEQYHSHTRHPELEPLVRMFKVSFIYSHTQSNPSPSNRNTHEDPSNTKHFCTRIHHLSIPYENSTTKSTRAPRAHLYITPTTRMKRDALLPPVRTTTANGVDNEQRDTQEPIHENPPYSDTRQRRQKTTRASVTRLLFPATRETIT